jgi:hypothetical protein
MQQTDQRPYLTEEEVDEICAPLKTGAAQARYLVKLGLHVERKPNGRPLVSRALLATVLTAGAPTTPANGPNWGTKPATPARSPRNSNTHGTR